MKRYSNNSVEMRTLYFTDGTAVFMFRGQVVETDKEVSYIPDGVKVKDIEPSPRKKPAKKKVEEDSTEEAGNIEE